MGSKCSRIWDAFIGSFKHPKISTKCVPSVVPSRRPSALPSRSIQALHQVLNHWKSCHQCRQVTHLTDTSTLPSVSSSLVPSNVRRKKTASQSTGPSSLRSETPSVLPSVDPTSTPLSTPSAMQSQGPSSCLSQTTTVVRLANPTWEPIDLPS